MEAEYQKGSKSRPSLDTASWCSKKVTFKQYFVDYTETLKCCVTGNKSSVGNIIKNLLDLPDGKELSSKEVNALNKEMDPDRFKIGKRVQVTNHCGETSSLPQLEHPKSDDNSLSLREEMNKIKERNEKREKNQITFRKRNMISKGEVLVDTTQRIGKKNLIPRQNFVVTFRVHKPFKHVIGGKGRPAKCAQEINVLNYQTLSDLRESIFCEADYQDVCGDVSDCPNMHPVSMAKDKYKSGMFYFDNTFYVDTQPGAEDYSKVIKEWATPRGIELGETVPMNSMKVEDLEVRFGYPYVYKHQGSCEHLIIISNARLLNTKDSLHSSDYPNVTKISRSVVEYCGTCNKKAASWIVYGSDRMIQDCNLMCDSCFKSFHYIGDQKIGNFHACRWMQRALLYA